MEQFNSTQPIYIQIVERIKKEIASGVLTPNQQLPTVRDLALTYQVNPNTVQRAYSELEREAIVRSERTTGRFVSSDAQLIKKLRKDMLEEKIKEFVHELHQLNVDLEESIEYIKEVFKKEEVNLD